MAGTSTEDVSEFLEDNGVYVISCEYATTSTEHWDERPSFHIEMVYSNKKIIMQESFWDLGVKMRN